MNRKEEKFLPLYFGPVFDRPFAVILNSRQSKTPFAGDRWVANTLKAIDFVNENRFTLLTSVGLNTWELSLYAGSEKGVNRIVTEILYRNETWKEKCDKILEDFSLDPDKTGFYLIETDIPETHRKDAWQLRDAILLQDADILIPVSVRAGGSMETLLNDLRPSRRVIEDFVTGYEGSKDRKMQKLDIEGIEQRFPTEKWNYITHWTHTSNGKWSFEKSTDYYRDISSSQTEYPRSAFHSLANILQGKKIHGGGTHSKSDIRYVSFTELDPARSSELMRWRSRWVRYTFEPYGIAIEKDAAKELGVRPVIYGDNSQRSKMPPLERIYFQTSDNIGNWRMEREWRFSGDFDFSAVPSEKLLAIVRNPFEAERLQDITKIAVVSLEG